jgi:hypothetical protein
MAGNFEPTDHGYRLTQDTVSFADMPDRFPGEVIPQHEPLHIGSVTPNARQVPQYGLLELAVDLGATYDNPYGPDDVLLDAAFTAPSGKSLVVPGFFMIQHRRGVHDGTEIMIPEDNGTWRVRFAPGETGRYSWKLKLKDRTGELVGGEGTFQAVAGESPGFIGKSAADPHYLAFDNGHVHRLQGPGQARCVSVRNEDRRACHVVAAEQEEFLVQPCRRRENGPHGHV